MIGEEVGDFVALFGDFAMSDNVIGTEVGADVEVASEIRAVDLAGFEAFEEWAWFWVFVAELLEVVGVGLVEEDDVDAQITG